MHLTIQKTISRQHLFGQIDSVVYIFTRALLSPFLNKLASYDFYHQECECRIPVSYKIYNHTNPKSPSSEKVPGSVFDEGTHPSGGGRCPPPPNQASLGEGVYQPLKQILGGLMCTNFLLPQIKLAWEEGVYQTKPQRMDVYQLPPPQK